MPIQVCPNSTIDASKHLRLSKKGDTTKATKMHKGREPGEASCFGVSPQLMGSLDRNAPSIPLQFLGDCDTKLRMYPL